MNLTRRAMFYLFCFVLLISLPTQGMGDDPPAKSVNQPSPAQQEIMKAYAELASELGDKQKQLMETKDAVVKEKLLDEIGKPMANKLWPIIQKYPDDRMVFMQLMGCVASGHKEATDFLFAKFDQKESAIGDVCVSLGKQHAMRMDRLCRVVIERTKNESNRGLALLGLSYWLMKESDVTAFEGNTTKADVCRKEAKDALEDTIKRHGMQKLDLGPMGGVVTLQSLAEGALFELKSLRIGMKAPDLSGTDMEGKPLTTKDFPNKIIMLSFWAHWCGPCMALVPKERALVERLSDKAFVLIGINGDEISDEIRAKTKEAKITWRSIQNQPKESDPKISTQWNVITWPTIYLIDQQGIIRGKWIGTVDEKELNRVLDELLGDNK